VSECCSTATEGRQKNCCSESELADRNSRSSSHPQANSPEKTVSGGSPFIRSNHVDSDRPTFNWSDWSQRVARLNAPREDGATLIEPPLTLAGQMAALNADLRLKSDYDIQGRSLSQLAAEAHSALLAEALRYTRCYRDVRTPNSARLVLAGHQPEMFHPGVWFKNFVLAKLSEQCDAVAVNLQIDSDAMKTASLRIPGGTVDQPRMEYIQFDHGAAELPFEQRGIVDRDCFNSFGERATRQLQTLVPDAFLARYWPLATARAKETNNIGASISQARHQCEAAWGLQTLEIPQSRVCDLAPVRWFVSHLLAHLPRLWETYNSALMEYRHKHKVRSAAHPVPELDSVDGWLEAPLWIWSKADPRRRALFVRQREDELILTDREQIEFTLSITPEGDASRAVEQLAAAATQGIRVRTRALITTMAARLLLGELFVHGIGGAKYDQLTDRIIEQFFGLQPPGYLVASGTLRLPVSQSNAATESVHQIRQRIRELDFHPERFLDLRTALSKAANGGKPQSDMKSPIDAMALVSEKRRLLATPANPENARQRCRALRQINENLQPAVAELRELWSSQAKLQSNRERSEALLRSREYAFTLFPEPILTKFLLPVLENSRPTG
jgi:hypothetical protein